MQWSLYLLLITALFFNECDLSFLTVDFCPILGTGLYGKMSAAIFLKTACLGLSEVHTFNSCCNLMHWNAALAVSKLFLYLAAKIEAGIKVCE